MNEAMQTALKKLRLSGMAQSLDAPYNSSAMVLSATGLMIAVAGGSSGPTL